MRRGTAPFVLPCAYDNRPREDVDGALMALLEVADVVIVLKNDRLIDGMAEASLSEATATYSEAFVRMIKAMSHGPEPVTGHGESTQGNARGALHTETGRMNDGGGVKRRWSGLMGSN